MRSLSIAILILISTCVLKAQTTVDTIRLSSGETVLAVVKEITPDEIKYVVAGNPDGPLFVMPKSKVQSITYSNGVKEEYTSTLPSQGTSHPSGNSSRNYDNYQGRTSIDANAKEYEFGDRTNRNTPIVYYGIDFTLVKFVGSSGFNDPAKIVDVYLDKINQKIIMEQDKYDMGVLFKRRDFDIDLEMLSGRNRSINPYDVVTNSNNNLSEVQIRELISTYNPQAQEGIGLVVVMESLNKLREQGTMYFTFFDIKTKKVVDIRKASGEPSGFGITNYWMKPVYEAIKKLKRSY
ncbi:MAG TPA: hypothetical protein DCR04_06890 [Flavobacteriales bacterium]|nr:hypothetical protein [Flavobacteriales bacterium]